MTDINKEYTNPITLELCEKVANTNVAIDIWHIKSEKARVFEASSAKVTK